MNSILQLKGSSLGGLDPEVEDILQRLSEQANADEAVGLDALTPESLRSAPAALDPFGIVSEGLAAVDDVTIEGPTGQPLGLRIYTPEGKGPFPVITFFHGGCWVFCDLDTHDSICRYLAAGSQALVVSVDYRLAPEHKFPDSLEDAYHATRWAQRNAARYNADGNQLIVAGDSAGGNIAAVVAILARQRATLDLIGQVLIYPITDIANKNTQSHAEFAEGYFFESAFFEWACQHYVDDEKQRQDWRVSPLLTDDLSGLPPTFVLTAEFDILRDEGERYAQRLHEAGVATRVTRYRGMVHAFAAMAGNVGVGKAALDDCNEFINSLRPKSE